MDQLMTYYSFLHKTVKWWRKVFFWLLEVIVVNSYIIYKEKARENGRHILSHKKYRKVLVNVLVEPVKTTGPPRHTRTRLPQNLERLQPTRHTLSKGTKRRDCAVCSTRDGTGDRHLTLYYCTTCRNTPYLCPSVCFDKYHTTKNYRT